MLEPWILYYRSIVVVAKAKGRAMKSFVFNISTNNWTQIHIKVSGSFALFQKSFLITFHQQSLLFLVASNHTRTFVFQARTNSWIENQKPLFDHEFLLNAEQVSVFQLSNKHNRLGFFRYFNGWKWMFSLLLTNYHVHSMSQFNMQFWMDLNLWSHPFTI